MRPDNFTLDYTHPLAQGLVFAGLGAYAGSNRYHDSSGYGNNGTLTNMDPASDWVSTLGRRGLDFEAGIEHVLGVAPVSVAPMTISTWAKVDDVSGNYIIVSLGNYLSLGNYFGILAIGGSFAGIARDASSNIPWGATVYTANILYHIVCTHTSSTRRELFIDGVSMGVDTNDIAPAGVNKIGIGTYIAGDWKGWPLNGAVYDTIIHNRVLTLAEIQQLADPSNVMLSGLIREVGDSHNVYNMEGIR